MHPLGKYVVPVGIGLLILAMLWWALGPFIGYIANFWPFLAIAIGLGIFLWKFPLDQLSKLFALQPLRGIFVFVVLTAIYGGFVWGANKYVMPLIVKEAGVNPLLAWLAILLLFIITIPALWYLYSAVGIPGNPKTIQSGLIKIGLAVLIFSGWLLYLQPNLLFNPDSGSARFWVAKEESKIYFHGGFSPSSGEKLVQGTPEDAKKLKKEPWTERLWKWWYSTPAPRAVATVKLPALPQEVALQLVRGTLSQKVFPHPKCGDVKIRGPQGTYVEFSDGTRCPVTKLPARSKKWTSGFRLGNEANEGPVLITFS